jgi:hypothetical protein
MGRIAGTGDTRNAYRICGEHISGIRLQKTEEKIVLEETF